jgi:prevent-host-death family protein
MTEPFDVFTVRDLRNRTGDLMRDAEEGRLSIITKHGRTAILAIPFDERLLAFGVHRSLALHLFEAGQATTRSRSRVERSDRGRRRSLDRPRSDRPANPRQTPLATSLVGRDLEPSRSGRHG